jgi:hypothetical protein
MPSVHSHFLPVSGIVSGNDTGTGKKENPNYKLHKFACSRVGGRRKLRPPTFAFRNCSATVIPSSLSRAQPREPKEVQRLKEPALSLS